MTNHRPASSAHGAYRGRHRKPRPSLQKLIYDRLIVSAPTRIDPAREITLRARRSAARQRRAAGGRDA
ncbi:hypothetical protein Caci_4082 [Catenulispora acidiphila DSM 44928]|uniref:Uncharacterized protein n=1 Tax=Catenulispora acidiphila (strain DSM 44928 / JCM 14897 / NBRC 102108 / NRRL B-24433 / ID139908) TaxID=479433 RepID=C7QGA2_CATAD|nr:hypothetical protein [Catenulispora acidiphila]ACU72947.1 hypothetical protein Caci_4082 [Catenulispora acidiphila DSM 44928]